METTPYIVNGFNYIKSENVEKEDVWGNISYIKEFKAYKIESGIMSFYKKDLNSISFSGIADDKTPVVNAAIGFDAHNDVDAYGYDKNNEWYNVELKF